MNLYQLNDEMRAISEALEQALAWEPDTNADGKPIDFDGNEIENVENFRAKMLAECCRQLEELSGDFDEKAGKVAAYIKNLKSDCEQLKKEETALQNRRKVKENALENMTAYLLDAMSAAGEKKIETPQAVISIRNNAESVEIADEEAVVKWAQVTNRDYVLKYRQPDISKTELKTLLKSGEKVPGAALARTQSLIVK